MAPLLNLILQKILSAQWLRGRACIDVSARRMQGRTDAAALGESAALVLPALLYPSFPIYIYPPAGACPAGLSYLGWSCWSFSCGLYLELGCSE